MDYRFSLTENNDSEAIAIIKNSDNLKLKGKLIYLNKTDEDNIDSNKEDLLFEFAKSYKIKQSDYDELLECIKLNNPPDGRLLQKYYTDFKSYLKKSNEIILKGSQLEVIPKIGNDKFQDNESLLICGAKGSGKSYFAAQYMQKFNKFFPKSPIFLLSNKSINEEPMFKGIKNIVQIPLNEEVLTSITGVQSNKKIKKLTKDEKKLTKKVNKKPVGKNKYFSSTDSEEEDEDVEVPDEILLNTNISAHQFFKSTKSNESLVVFDDFESSAYEGLVRMIINNVVSVGRSSRIYSLIITHVLCNGQKSKLLLGEVDAFILFPHGISPYHIKYALTNYSRLSSNQITKILDSNSRWTFIKKSGITNYVIEENRLWMF